MLSSLRRSLADKFASDPLLAQAGFIHYWLSSILTSFGTHIGALGMPLCSIMLLHATPAQMGLLTACQAIPFAVLALPAGVWLDRRRKLPILLASKLLQGLSLASIPLAWWLGWLTMPWMYDVAIVQGACSVVGGGAEQIFLTFLVGRERMIEAQARLTTTDSISRLVGPGLGGLLVQWLTAPFALAVDAAGLLASGWTLSKVKTAEPQPAPSGRHPLQEMHDGFRFIWRQPLLRSLAWGAACWHMLFYGYGALNAIFVTRDLGMSAGMMGAAQVLGGCGVLLSSFIVRPLNARFGAGRTILVGTAATTAGFVLMPCVPPMLFGSPYGSTAAAAVIAFVFDCGVMLFFLPYLSLRQKVTPDEYLGRMVSTMRFLTVATAPLGALAAGYMAEHLSVRTALACIGAGGLLLTAAMSSSRPLRSVRP
jgi:MFS family permease